MIFGHRDPRMNSMRMITRTTPVTEDFPGHYARLELTPNILLYARLECECLALFPTSGLTVIAGGQSMIWHCGGLAQHRMEAK